MFISHSISRNDTANIFAIATYYIEIYSRQIIQNDIKMINN